MKKIILIMIGIFLVSMLFVYADTIHTIYVIDPLSSKLYFIPLNGSSDSDIERLIFSFKNGSYSDNNGNFFIYAPPGDILNSGLNVELDLMNPESAFLDSLIDPNTGKHFNALTISDIKKMGLRADFGRIVKPNIGINEGQQVQDQTLTGISEQVDQGANTSGQDLILDNPLGQKEEVITLHPQEESNINWGVYLSYGLALVLIIAFVFYMHWVRKKNAS